MFGTQSPTIMKKHSLTLLAIFSILSQSAFAETSEPAAPASEATETTEATPSSGGNGPVFVNPFASSASAAVADAPKFSVKPTGRILADGAVFGPDGSGFTDGVALPDIRIGVQATYGNWMAKVDLGFGSFKFSMKDVFIQYKFNPENLLRGGYFVHQFGLQSATSSSFKNAIEAPTTDDFMNATGRNLGIMYQLDKPKFHWGMSVIFGNKGNLTGDGVSKMSVGAVTRLVWRPIARTGEVVQVGMSGWYQSPTHYKDADGKCGPGEYSLSANFPTRVVKVGLISANITDAGNQLKLSPELLLSKDRFGLEAQYYYMNIDRHNGLPNYVAQGCYGQLRCLLFGQTQYAYSVYDAGLATPSNKTLEFVAGYNYTNASHKDIRGGITNDWSATFNFYLNKYVIFRLGYRYTNVRDAYAGAPMPKRHENIIVGRVQFKF